MPESVMSMIPIYLVRRIDVVVTFYFILVHIGTVSVRLHVWAGIAGDIVGTGCIVC